MAETASIGTAQKPYPNFYYAWFVVICLQFAYAIALVDRQILALLVEPVKADLNLTDTEFSLLAGIAFALFYAVMGLVLGRVADQRNRRNMVIIGMLLWSAATIGCGLARNYTELFIARIIVGAGEAALSPAAYSMIADFFSKDQRSRPTAFYTMGIFTGSGVALLFGAAVVAFASRSETLVLPLFGELRNWQAVFVAVGMPGIVMAIIMMFIKEPERREIVKQGAPLSEFRPFLAKHGKLIALLIAAFALNGVIYYGVNTWTPALFIRKFGWEASEIGYIMGMIQLVCGGGGILAAGWWVSRPSVRGSGLILVRQPRISLMLMPVFALLIGFGPTSTISLVGLALFVFLIGTVSAQSAVAIYQVVPNQFRGQVIAMYLLTGTLLGLGFGVTLIALFTDYVFANEQMVGASCAIVFIASALAAAECLRRAEKSIPDADEAIA